MSWVRIDDTMTFNHKIVAAGNAAVGAWIRLSAYSSAHGLDGKIPDSVARMIASRKELEAAMGANLLHRIDDGYEVHDFLEYNPSAAEVAERRSKRQNAGRNGGKKSGDSRRSKSEANASSFASTSDEAEENRDASTKTNPGPARPGPEEEKEPEAPSAPRSRFDFEAVYERYPLKKGKAKGLESLEKLVKTQAKYDAVMAGVVKFAAEEERHARNPGKDFHPSPPYFSTWVNEQRWQDYSADSLVESTQPALPLTALDRIKAQEAAERAGVAS
jgi:hypothetical protein